MRADGPKEPWVPFAIAIGLFAFASVTNWLDVRVVIPMWLVFCGIGCMLAYFAAVFHDKILWSLGFITAAVIFGAVGYFFEKMFGAPHQLRTDILSALLGCVFFADFLYRAYVDR